MTGEYGSGTIRSSLAATTAPYRVLRRQGDRRRHVRAGARTAAELPVLLRGPGRARRCRTDRNPERSRGPAGSRRVGRLPWPPRLVRGRDRCDHPAQCRRHRDLRGMHVAAPARPSQRGRQPEPLHARAPAGQLGRRGCARLRCAVQHGRPAAHEPLRRALRWLSVRHCWPGGTPDGRAGRGHGRARAGPGPGALVGHQRGARRRSAIAGPAHRARALHEAALGRAGLLLGVGWPGRSRTRLRRRHHGDRRGAGHHLLRPGRPGALDPQRPRHRRVAARPGPEPCSARQVEDPRAFRRPPRLPRVAAVLAYATGWAGAPSRYLALKVPWTILGVFVASACGGTPSPA